MVTTRSNIFVHLCVANYNNSKFVTLSRALHNFRRYMCCMIYHFVSILAPYKEYSRFSSDVKIQAGGRFFPKNDC